MTEFTKQECLRLIDKLAETDPTTEAYHIVLSSIERLDAIGTTIDEIAKMREGGPVIKMISAKELMQADPATLDPPTLEELADIAEEEKLKVEQLKKLTVEATPPFEVADFPADVKDDLVKQDSAKTYSASEVRKALVEARSKGADVKAILAKVGADNFTAVPEAKYGELMSLLGA